MTEAAIQATSEDRLQTGAFEAGLQSLGWKARHGGESPLRLHAPLLFWLTENLKPAACVTLGSHGSASHLAVCQAVLQLGLPTRCYSMADTGVPLQPAVRDEHDRLYAGFSKLLPAGWDEDGLQHFRCGAIDWLQVDGEQELEQLRLNWRSWRRRLSARAVLSIHGSNAAMSQPLGAWISRLQNCHPWAGFSHGEGLLLLGVGEQQSAPLQWLFQTLQSPLSRPMLQLLFARLGADCGESDQDPSGPQAGLEQAQQPALEAALDEARQYGRRAGLLQAQLQGAQQAGEAARAEANLLAQRLQQSESSVKALEHELQSARAQLQQQARRLEDRFRELGQLTRMVEDKESELRALREQSAQSLGAVRLAAVEGLSAASVPAREALPLAMLAQLIAQSGLFDESWYRSTYPDVAAAGVSPIEHYLQFGAAERRNPSAAFDTAWYCRRYPEAAASGLNPLVHYIRHGRDKGALMRPRLEPFHA